MWASLLASHRCSLRGAEGAEACLQRHGSCVVAARAMRERGDVFRAEADIATRRRRLGQITVPLIASTPRGGRADAARWTH